MAVSLAVVRKDDAADLEALREIEAMGAFLCNSYHGKGGDVDYDDRASWDIEWEVSWGKNSAVYGRGPTIAAALAEFKSS